ncbi:phosphoribosylanthranilate isomerase [Galbibacter sp.]|uniref:phosphoribosylanthranilate isomerase n=1 Tax=Galbibacter sp. TaxID=2918471 RepID=UPI003A94CC70
MKYQDNIQQIGSLVPDYLGFIFYEKSPRNFTGPLPLLPKSVKKIGVFVDATTTEVLEKVTQFGLNGIQLHGRESSAYCEELKVSLRQAFQKGSITQLPLIIKVFSVKDHFDFSVLKTYEPIVDYFLFDTKGVYAGGNGYTFDWELLKDYPSEKPFFLSGGIGIEQLEAIKNIDPNLPVHAIDVNSQFEQQPGLKDSTLIKEFIIKLDEIKAL